MPFIIGKKIEMTQVFQEDKVIPVTLIQAGPCYVTQLKDNKKDGYEAVQIGFEKKKKNIKKPEKGKEYRYLKEFIKEDVKMGEEITVSTFKEGDKVEIAGISKGKGFQGAVKRWGFHGRNATHGVKHEERTLGSVGSTGPARVFKGKKMPGRMGSERKTIKKVEIVKIDEENNVLAVKGAVPGKRGTLIEIYGGN